MNLKILRCLFLQLPCSLLFVSAPHTWVITMPHRLFLKQLKCEWSADLKLYSQGVKSDMISQLSISRCFFSFSSACFTLTSWTKNNKNIFKAIKRQMPNNNISAVGLLTENVRHQLRYKMHLLDILPSWSGERSQKCQAPYSTPPPQENLGGRVGKVSCQVWHLCATQAILAVTCWHGARKKGQKKKINKAGGTSS